MRYADLEIQKVMCGLAVRHVERRADEIQVEVEEAEKARAESLRRQNMSPLEAKVEGLERANAYLAARVTKLEGGQPGRQPLPSQVAPARAPQMPGMSGGPFIRDGGVRKLGTNGSVSEPDTAGAGFTRRQHPLDVIGGGGRR